MAQSRLESERGVNQKLNGKFGEPNRGLDEGSSFQGFKLPVPTGFHRDGAIVSGRHV